MHTSRFVTPLAIALLAAAPAVAQAQLTLVYDTQDVVHKLVNSSQGPGLSPERGALRQDPGAGAMLAPHGDPTRHRVSKVSGAGLARLTPRQMAAVLRREITLGSYGARAHLVTIDEIGVQYGDARPRVKRRGARLPTVSPRSPGAKFTQAMRMLNTPSPYGGTWASRVHVYVAPGVHTSIGQGRGPQRNLGRDGKPHLRSWRGLMPGLALAGGVHLQMYHGHAGRATAFNARRWRTIPAAFLGLMRRHGARSNNVHFLFSAAGMPRGVRGCANAAACSWKLAESTPAGRAILRNGPGVYRIGPDAEAWLSEYNQRFPIS